MQIKNTMKQLFNKLPRKKKQKKNNKKTKGQYSL